MQHFRTREGVRIAAEIRQAGPAHPRLALLHSLGMDRSFWAPLVERLAPEASILTIDARGHGESDKPAAPYAVPRMAQDLRDVLDAIGWPDVVVAGASMGGCIALQFAAEHADRTRALGLIDTTAWYGPKAPEDWAARAARAQAEGLVALVDFQRTRWFSDAYREAHPDEVERWVQVFLRNDVPAFVATCGMLGAFDARGALSSVRVPTAVVVGEEDYATPLAMAEALHAGIAGSTLKVIAKARHLTPLETPDVVADELRRLLVGARTART